MKLLYFLLGISSFSLAQEYSITGKVLDGQLPVYQAKIQIEGSQIGAITDSAGTFHLDLPQAGDFVLICRAAGFTETTQRVKIHPDLHQSTVFFQLQTLSQEINEVVVSGTLKAVGRLDSPVPVEVYQSCFFKSNPTPSVFDALTNVNGVRPQINCNICNTGDIHINGLEGPYTMVLIDGMPIVSGLSTVYGLSGIPQSLIDRVEIVKGPASTLYGSEAVGGLINIITKQPTKASALAFDHFVTSWGESNNDISFKIKTKRTQHLTGINYYNFQIPTDKNGDGFTDVTLQDRTSVFHKINIQRKSNRLFQIAGRYVYEDRWGGQMNWTPEYRGTDSLYAESIYTSRWELFGTYQLPVKGSWMYQFSANGHQQNSFYGTTPFHADQRIFFNQLIWNKVVGRHDLTAGSAFRATYYDDNTTATAMLDSSQTQANLWTLLPGIFVQDQIQLSENHQLLTGLRYDYNHIHGSIFSPRLNYRWKSSNRLNILRFGVGNGYRVANVFTEDHAALTGARKVVFTEALKPETSYNTNVNFIKQIPTKNVGFITFDATVFYTYFHNKILPDYNFDPNLIVYSNLDGFAESKGVSLNIDWRLNRQISLFAGGTFQNISVVENGESFTQILTERASGVWRFQYKTKNEKFTFDYNGNLYGKMLLPLLGPLDERDPYSPVHSIQNIQITYTFKKNWEIYGGIKNLLNFTPPANSIARAHDPFDREVQFDANGQVIATPNNPQALTFDPSYIFASNQGIRGFLGVRFTWR